MPDDKTFQGTIAGTQLKPARLVSIVLDMSESEWDALEIGDAVTVTIHAAPGRCPECGGRIANVGIASPESALRETS